MNWLSKEVLHLTIVGPTQIAQHVAKDTLRVKTLDNVATLKAGRAIDLASFDLVIITFERLRFEEVLGKTSPVFKVTCLQLHA